MEHDPVQPDPSVAGCRVALVCMPFASGQRPSIQIGLITAVAEQAGFEVDAFHFNLDLAAQLSPALYENFCEHRGHLTGEWMFAPAAFRSSAPSDEASYFRAFPGELEWARQLGKDEAFLVDLRQRVLPGFIENCLTAVDWSRYRVVGFSSVFQQSVACLALARRIKECHPNVAIVFGGANMEGEMGREYARAFPFIDYTVSGEGDHVFPALLRSLEGNGHAAPLPGGVVTASNGVISGSQAAPVNDLDASPIPNYRPYFERAIQLGLLPHYKAGWMIPFESSRGCWWGEKQHCTFCGLNGLGMAFRAKSPQRVLEELSELARRHSICSFEAVDNILDIHYIQNFFAKIEEAKLDYRFFYEVKVNLTRSQIKALYRGGVRNIQPGIESMSTPILRLMRKGCTMLQNVRLLKWCLYYGIRVGWNLLSGFPGETEADCQKQIEILRCIEHLEPPSGCTRIWLERFSPYYTDRQTFPVFNVRPLASYRYVYPEHVNLDRAAYFFDYEMGDTLEAGAYADVETFVAEWQQSWQSDQRHSLTYRRIADGVLIDYNWGPQRQGTYSLYGVLGLIYESCIETMHSVDHVVKCLRESPEGYEFSHEEVTEAMDEFCRGRLMCTEDGKYLSLAIPSNPNW
jgi:ribosomal peptide maturation radical SAM protein 1